MAEGNSILTRISAFPDEILQGITDRLSHRDLKTIIVTSSFLKRFAFKSLYRSVAISYLDFDSAEDISYLDVQHEEENIHDLLISDNSDYRAEFPHRHSNDSHMYCFNSYLAFQSFLSQNPGFIPDTIYFESEECLFDLNKTHASLLRNVKSIQINIETKEYSSDEEDIDLLEDDTSYSERESLASVDDGKEVGDRFDERLSSVLALNLKITKLKIASAEGYANYTIPSHLDNLEICYGNISNVNFFFKSLYNLSTLYLKNVRIEPANLKYLPRCLRKLVLFKSLVFDSSNYCQLDLPDQIKELSITMGLCEEEEEGDYMLLDEQDGFDNTDQQGQVTILDINHLSHLSSFEYCNWLSTSVCNVKLPSQILELSFHSCPNLIEMDGLNQYYQLRALSLKECNNLSVCSFLINSALPDSLQELEFINSEVAESNLLQTRINHPEYFFQTDRGIFFKWDNKIHLPPNLKYLELANNSYLELANDNSIRIDSSLKLPPNLKHFSLRKLGEFINFNSFHFPNELVSLSLRDMNIGSLDGIRLPDTLIILDLSSNHVESIQNTNISDLFSLSRLILTSNNIKSFHLDFSRNLRFLSLQDNQLDQCNVAKLNGLHSLDLSGNTFKKMLNNKSLALPQNLISLKLNAIANISIADGFKFPRNLKELELSSSREDYEDFNENVFDSIPKSIQRLYLGSGKIGVSSKINLKFPNLTSLVLFDNIILPENFGLVCARLEILHLENNGLSQLDVSCLPLSIKSVSLRSNGMHSIVGNFERFRELKNLDFGGNKLDPWLKENKLILPKNLFSFDLSDNGVTNISNIYWNESISIIRLHGNENLDETDLLELGDKFLTKVPSVIFQITLDDEIVDPENVEFSRLMDAKILKVVDTY
ncbi:uncharacterized protein RJT20DRAFT_134585 [Scheffersomyces xylosifermentans]|uniref:uncharacterized protein n=1 Tax=Scheffersomyces xylosifermentans TaxID=1304137 RepID=UPI00315CDFDD